MVHPRAFESFFKLSEFGLQKQFSHLEIIYFYGKYSAKRYGIQGRSVSQYPWEVNTMTEKESAIRELEAIERRIIKLAWKECFRETEASKQLLILAENVKIARELVE